ncbi:uncharacterized protein BO97DRAFT_285260 [Aspergillus homomorphus CBS 101889]|uniref:Uncharacterized protein n=1 Tax=Aspergillus homomorphus (strain CBS 101889) TaxID=1450537 RepID=A0A395I3Y6_ASPHC|nr:hypothetical protein BO97DRAFT_285260 [Aspergillus homomorphus CBS 101889]RAL14446.1 hypothetical protein BO97DRAFT_285260 [Aspergillus homomorphus CBS 101889]
MPPEPPEFNCRVQKTLPRTIGLGSGHQRLLLIASSSTTYPKKRGSQRGSLIPILPPSGPRRIYSVFPYSPFLSFISPDKLFFFSSQLPDELFSLTVTTVSTVTWWFSFPPTPLFFFFFFFFFLLPAFGSDVGC